MFSKRVLNIIQFDMKQNIVKMRSLAFKRQQASSKACAVHRMLSDVADGCVDDAGCRL